MCFSAVFIVGDEGGDGKAATAVFEVNICVSLVLNDPQEEAWTLVEALWPGGLFSRFLTPITYAIDL